MKLIISAEPHLDEVFMKFLMPREINFQHECASCGEKASIWTLFVRDEMNFISLFKYLKPLISTYVKSTNRYLAYALVSIRNEVLEKGGFAENGRVLCRPGLPEDIIPIE